MRKGRFSDWIVNSYDLLFFMVVLSTMLVIILMII